ncbi:Adenosine deaminase [Purpureocillium takamizusanense]|uniref:Adenine deaminase n=1 Tax=Purpureocillium takamizusanense TaxID=2060973 RepID=A0A9Q8QSR2_9HYPO|nr:Adenosine deaminase [Purpureocillium takamizusanense]UNI24596.1 Adenosine deaminase [Purpureocillium takamizusanense]
MCKSPLHDLLVALPKVEHHLHVEGTLEPPLLFALAAKNNVALPDDPAYASPEALLARYAHWTCLDDFLHYYYQGMSVLVTAADFEALAWAYFVKAAAQRVRHAEVFFDPQAHTARGVSYDTVVEGLGAAKRRAVGELGITVEYIVCVLRHLPLADSHVLVDTVLDRGHLSPPHHPPAALAGAGATATQDVANSSVLAGFGMVSSEKDFPPELFKELYARVALTGTRLTAHAGEEAGPEFVTASLDHLGVERIDHGLSAARDPALVTRLASSGTLLTLCPWSNVRLCNIPELGHAPVRAYLDGGVRFSINSDDPAYFGAYIQEVYCRVQDEFALSVADWEWILRGAIDASWCRDERKGQLVAELDVVLAEHRSLGRVLQT